MTEKIGKQPKELVFSGNTTRNWEFFKQKFQIYLQASKMEDENDTYKAALLLNTIGDEALKIYNNLVFESETDKNSYKKIVEKLDEYFIPTKNITYERHVFFLREMKETETIDEYINDLRRLSSNCEFGTLTDSLIKDRIVLGVRDRALKDRLLRENNLDLKKATDICKASEQARKHLEEIDLKYKNKEVDAVIAGTRRKKFQCPARNSGLPDRNVKALQRKEKKVCFCCGNDHPIGKDHCPARKAKCFKCEKVGHFSKVCKNKKLVLLQL